MATMLKEPKSIKYLGEKVSYNDDLFPHMISNKMDANESVLALSEIGGKEDKFVNQYEENSMGLVKVIARINAMYFDKDIAKQLVLDVQKMVPTYSAEKKEFVDAFSTMVFYKVEENKMLNREFNYIQSNIEERFQSIEDIL